MALLQGPKKLFGPLTDDLDCISAVKEAMELQVGIYVSLIMAPVRQLICVTEW
jgi:hypothetical protein